MYTRSTKKKEVVYQFSDGTEQSFAITVAAVVTKFDSVFTIVNNFLLQDQELKTNYESFVKEYVESTKEDRMRVFLKYVDKLIPMIDRNIDSSDVLNNIVVKEDSRFSINVTHEESSLIIRSSIRTRFFLFCYLSDISLTSDQQKVLHSHICREMLDTGVVDKLYKILNSIVLSTYPDKGGKKLWDLMSSTGGYNSDSHALKLLASMFYKSLPSLDPSDNPIAYMISIAKNEMDWLLRTNFSVSVFNSYIDASSISPNISSNSRLLENEVYNRTIIKGCFAPISEEYTAYTKLKNHNLYPTVYNISQPLIHKVFNVPIRNLSLDNTCVLNFYTHRFLKKYDPEKDILMDMLLSIPVFSNRGTDELPEDMKKLLYDILVDYKGQKAFSFLSRITIKKIFLEAITSLYKYAYEDPLGVVGEEIDLDWPRLIEQYVSYIYKLANGEYQEGIEEEQNSLKLTDEEIEGGVIEDGE